jgi:hypothetical protein
MRLELAPLLLAAVTACAAPEQSIPVDHVGLRERWRHACALEKMSAFEGTCAERGNGFSESDGAADWDESGAPSDAAGTEPPDETEADSTALPFFPSPSAPPSYGQDGGG